MSHVLSRDVPEHIFMSLSSNCSAGLRWEQIQYNSSGVETISSATAETARHARLSRLAH